MNKSIIAFLLGAGIGSVIAWQLTERKYAEWASPEDIDEIRKVYAKDHVRQAANEDSDSEEQICKKARNKPDVEAYADLIRKHNYSNYSKADAIKDEGHKDDIPYVIPPTEFGEFDDYSRIELTYYEDGVLADELDEEVEDADDIVGEDFASHFGEYEDDSVYIRNDSKRSDYLILKDNRKFADVVKNQPHPVEVE